MKKFKLSILLLFSSVIAFSQVVQGGNNAKWEQGNTPSIHQNTILKELNKILPPTKIKSFLSDFKTSEYSYFPFLENNSSAIVSTLGVEYELPGSKESLLYRIMPYENKVLEVKLHTVFPNPNSGQELFCKYETSQKGIIHIIISNTSGQTILFEKQAVIQGTNTFGIDINSLQEGIYFIIINHNEKTTNQRFIVMK